MSREIKFRCWVDADKKMYNVLQFQDKFPEEDFYRVFINKERVEGQPMNYRITGGNAVMQYTGLKDKNGKEIYEGDMVQRHSIVKEVKWFIGNSDCGWNIGKGYISIGGRNTIEIIGNIYENPEFINK